MWWSSLPLRVIALTVAGSVLVLLLGGLLLMRQASSGVLAGKRTSAVAEASTALERMQVQLRSSDMRSTSVYERLNKLADEAGAQPSQYRVVIQGPVSRFVSPGISEESVPDSLVQEVARGDGMYVTPTTVVWAQIPRREEPGLAIGAMLQAPSGQEGYPIYFIFPESHEAQTLSVLRRAIASTSVVLLLALGGIAWLVSREVMGPVREASIAASKIASGDFEERMRVRGTDDLASLATSMNDMAAELSHQIGQLEDLSRVQQRFVSDVSHELRTPLTTVRMAADLLHEGRYEMDPFAARSTELMQEELDRFEAMLADLLEISRFDAGAAVLSLAEHDLVPVVRREMEAQQAFAERLGCRLELHGIDSAVAMMDDRRITRILRNLLTNAIEHGERQPIIVTVGADEQSVAVTVRDHGIGFAPHLADQVFLRFWRADPSRTRAVGGTGLGLAISLEDANLHRGWLRAWGRPHRGAQFLLVLPRDEKVTLRDSPLPLVPRERS
ncbi:Sensor histidine kinase MtrB [Luteococcus japonicus LSP_Lj1]|uniref:Sensor histidine kinase MtrB n=1 Tax=Luteococcus japonicus LSP_Lj1 TaxID=1255658 RepID=A0A1R4JUV4_9ACTN|nr:Sensor histidine kinase MtrB [Luteococcus japonicus LSP_Lj1]